MLLFYEVFKIHERWRRVKLNSRSPVHCAVFGLKRIRRAAARRYGTSRVFACG